MSIAAEAKRESEVKEGERLLRSERYYGRVSRMLTLPIDVDPAKADAKYEGGVLTLMLPRVPGGEPKRLAVH
ncbi:MAG: Hsp20/alpha crystallin family protein [Casimicrobiaceae bacterium]